MPRWLLVILLAVLTAAIVAVVVAFLQTGPVDDQARSPDVPPRPAPSQPTR